MLEKWGQSVLRNSIRFIDTASVFIVNNVLIEYFFKIFTDYCVDQPARAEYCSTSGDGAQRFRPGFTEETPGGTAL